MKEVPEREEIPLARSCVIGVGRLWVETEIKGCKNVILGQKYRVKKVVRKLTAP